MKSTFVPLDIPSDVVELVTRDRRCSITKLAPPPTVVSLSFGFGHSSRHSDAIPFNAYASAYVDLAIEDLRERKSDPRLTVTTDNFARNTNVVLKTKHEQFHTNFACPPVRREFTERLAIAVANLYAAVDRQERIVAAVTARLSS